LDRKETSTDTSPYRNSLGSLILFFYALAQGGNADLQFLIKLYQFFYGVDRLEGRVLDRLSYIGNILEYLNTPFHSNLLKS
jgi:hypothetical protein